MSARILQFNKSFLDGVDSIDARPAAVLPPPRRRELDSGLFAKFAQRHGVKPVQTFHDRFIKSLPVMGIAKQWTDSLHLFSSLALTQCLVLTYPSRAAYITCVYAISQQSTYGDVFMRYAKSLEIDTLARDAALVNDLYVKCIKATSARNGKSFEAAQAWFIKKHECAWQEHVQTEERQRGCAP